MNLFLDRNLIIFKQLIINNDLNSMKKSKIKSISYQTNH